MLCGAILLLLVPFGPPNVSRLGQAGLGKPVGPAANFPQQCVARVFGHPATSFEVGEAVEASLNQQVVTTPLGTTTYTLPNARPLAAGKTATYSVRVFAQAPGTYPADGRVTVKVENHGEKFDPEKLLWFCNKPENLREEGPLFDGNLVPGQPVRLLYHHQNRGTHPLYMRILAVNKGASPATLLVIPGDGRPNRDPVRAGISSLRKYFPSSIAGAGEVVIIPPNSCVPLALRRLVMGETASGLCSLELLPNVPATAPEPTLETRAEALQPSRLTETWARVVLEDRAWHFVGAGPIPDPVEATYPIVPLVYTDPKTEAHLDYSAGASPATTQIGVEGIPKLGGGRHLNGNYGVTHVIHAKLANSTSEPVTFRFDLSATTNYTSGVFWMPSGLVAMRPLQQHERREFWSVVLPPNGTKSFDFYAIPVSGGYYPATISVSSIPRSEPASN